MSKNTFCTYVEPEKKDIYKIQHLKKRKLVYTVFEKCNEFKLE